MLKYLFLFIACILFINANNLKENLPISVIQKLTDKPKDRQIKINTIKAKNRNKYLSIN